VSAYNLCVGFCCTTSHLRTPGLAKVPVTVLAEKLPEPRVHYRQKHGSARDLGRMIAAHLIAEDARTDCNLEPDAAKSRLSLLHRAAHVQADERLMYSNKRRRTVCMATQPQ
jgi:hypothetical protein